MASQRRFGSDALQYLYDRYIGDDPDRIASYERARSNARVAESIYNLRTKAGLTQAQLALVVGTTASVISRLEDADYDGHSLSMLKRIAAAVGMGVDVRFVKRKSKRPAPASGKVLPSVSAGPKGGKASVRKATAKKTAVKKGAAKKAPKATTTKKAAPKKATTKKAARGRPTWGGR
jgi:transcriptional regulator with XRE-family HTH domain